MAKSSKMLLSVGCILVAASLGLLIFSHFHAQNAANTNAHIVAQIRSVIPSPTAGVMDTYLDMEMPALQIGGQDFIGLVDIPAFGLTLPIYSIWDTGTVTSFPCRFWGSVYDGSLIVGGADQPGQFDCLDNIQNGDTVTVTDMTGAQFSYGVVRVERAKSAQADRLTDSNTELTLFVRDTYNLDYIIVRCASEVPT